MYVGIITSDVTIDDYNADKLIERLKVLTIIQNIGVWQPSCDPTGKSCYGHNNGMYNMEYANLLEGWFLIIKKDVLDKQPEIDTHINLYGWQIDNVICTISKKIFKYLNIKDNNVIVYHPKDSGYNENAAR